MWLSQQIGWKKAFAQCQEFLGLDEATNLLIHQVGEGKGFRHIAEAFGEPQAERVKENLVKTGKVIK